jgi:hypothetical protein
MTRYIKHMLLSAALALPGVTMLGCSSDFDFDNDNHRYTTERYRDHLPSSARMLDGGHGEVSVRANDDGVVYLYDSDDRDVFWKGEVRRGDRITIEPEEDRAAINGDTIFRSNLVKDHEHRIYLDRR